MTTKPSVLFVCVANSCRSQIAEAIAKSLAADKWEIWSAGSHPCGSVHPLAIKMMEEIGLDCRAQYSKGLDELPQREWDYLVTMGCNDKCPTISARRRLDWGIPDPTGLSVEDVRRIRDDIRNSVELLLASHA